MKVFTHKTHDYLSVSSSMMWLCMLHYVLPGQQCQTEVNECESEPCFNSGTCTDQLNNFQCSCPQGFSGLQCEVNIDECDPDPCQNGAACVDLIDSFKCVCESGYTGWWNFESYIQYSYNLWEMIMVVCVSIFLCYKRWPKLIKVKGWELLSQEIFSCSLERKERSRRVLSVLFVLLCVVA